MIGLRIFWFDRVQMVHLNDMDYDDFVSEFFCESVLLAH